MIYLKTIQVLGLEKADNGFLLEDNDGDITVYQSADFDAHGDVFAARSLLYGVLEAIGMLGSKHDKARVRVFVADPDGNEIEEP
jgi:hypothetical protein